MNVFVQHYELQLLRENIDLYKYKRAIESFTDIWHNAKEKGETILYGFTDRRVARARKERGNKIGEVRGEKRRRRRKETELFPGKYAGSRFITASSFFALSSSAFNENNKTTIRPLFVPPHRHRSFSPPFLSRAHFFPPLFLCLAVEKKLTLSSFLSSDYGSLFRLVFRSFRLSFTLISEFVRATSRERPSCRRFLNRAEKKRRDGVDK